MIKSLNIEQTDDSPSISFDAEESLLRIEGISIPENTEKFYAPVMSWLEEYSQSPNKYTKVIFKILYYNSTSSIQFTKILKLLDRIYKKGNEIEVFWYYNPNDETIEEDGIEFSNFFEFSIKVVPIENA
jgi:hypothetical protein